MLIVILAIFVPLGASLLSWRYIQHLEVPIGQPPVYAIRPGLTPRRIKGRYPAGFT